jgi:Na+-translocating ferredoxin:NAD+ oxidoreductase RnfG subunit
MNATTWLRRNRRPLIVAALIAAVMLLPVPAPAHKGHSGPMVDFISSNDALKAMLPEGAHITRRKEAVKAEGAAWAQSSLGVSLNGDDIQTYLLARAADGEKVLGAAMEQEFDYEHGDIKLAVGVDAAGKVTKAAVLGANEQYVPEIKAAVGQGFLPDLEGVTVQNLSARADAAYKDKRNTAGDVLGHLRDMAAALATLTHGLSA